MSTLIVSNQQSASLCEHDVHHAYVFMVLQSTLMWTHTCVDSVGSQTAYVALLSSASNEFVV